MKTVRLLFSFLWRLIVWGVGTGAVLGAAFGALVGLAVGGFWGLEIGLIAGVMTGALVGVVLGVVNGIVLGVVTRVAFCPLGDQQRYRRSMRIVSTCLTLGSGILVFPLALRAFFPTTYAGLSVFEIIPPIIAAIAAWRLSKNAFEWYVYQR